VRDEEQETGLGLDEVLAALRADLLAARGHPGEEYGLGVREVEIELSVEVRRERQAEGSVGAKWFVLSADAGARASREHTDTHRITLTLGPTSSPGSGTEGATASEGVVGPPIAEQP
jgi:hypothetical protein